MHYTQLSTVLSPLSITTINRLDSGLGNSTGIIIVHEENMKKKLIRLMFVAGARPNFMKIAPLIHEICANGNGEDLEKLGVEYVLVHTGQHYDSAMSEQFFRQLRIPEPHVNLEVGSDSHSVQTANVMIGFEQVCLEHRPDWVVVVGDVNSTMACTLVASKLGIPVAHVEAGLRSFDRTMPEEINRLVTDALADLLLTPSEDADRNLQKEGVDSKRIVRVGNIMIDSLLANLKEARKSTIGVQLGLDKQEFAFVTLHRPSNVDHKERLAEIMTVLQTTSKQLPIVFSMHPRTAKMLQQFGIVVPENGSMKMIDPVGYHDSIFLTENARVVITDSGGLQEETTYFRTPCLTLRPSTERPITLTVGKQPSCQSRSAHG